MNISVILRSSAATPADADAVANVLRERYPHAVAIDVERGTEPSVHVEGAADDDAAERDVRAIVGTVIAPRAHVPYVEVDRETDASGHAVRLSRSVRVF